MKCVILQPSYIPWRGYFNQIGKADIFVFYDDVQYDKHGWRNRNQIKTAQGKRWLTIPVHSANVISGCVPINQIRINWDRKWNASHLASLRQAYSKAPFFDRYVPLLEEFYSQTPVFLANFTIDTTIALARELGMLTTRFVRSSELEGISGTRTDRLISILRATGATHYISGPSAKDYIEEEKFAAAGIGLEYMNYGYPEYPQLYPPYDPFVSILDLFFMCGPTAGKYI